MNEFISTAQNQKLNIQINQDDVHIYLYENSVLKLKLDKTNTKEDLTLLDLILYGSLILNLVSYLTLAIIAII